MTNHDRIKQAFNDVKAPKGFAESIIKSQKNTTLETPQRTGRKSIRKIFVIAAAICIVLSVTITAMATNFFGLQDTAIPNTDEIVTHEWPDGTVVEFQQQFISLQGFAGSPEHTAMVEWQEFVDSYDVEAILAIVGNTWIEEIPELFRFYGVYSLEMAYKLNEIMERHNLVLKGAMLPYHNDFDSNNLSERIAHGAIFGDAPVSYNGVVYESGTFWVEGSYGDDEIMMSMHAHRKGVFSDVFMNVGNLSLFTEWNYENRHGLQLLLSQSDYQSFIFLDTDVFFITVILHTGAKGSSWDDFTPPFSPSDLEHFADSIDFGQIRTDLPDLVRHEFPASITQEMIEQERSQILAKRAELDAERAVIDAIVFHFLGMWSYVGSEDANGATIVPDFYNEGLMIDADLRATFWSGEGVLEMFLRNEVLEPKPGDRLFTSFLTKVTNEEFQVSIGGFWNYTDEEISYHTADWDSMQLKYDAERGLVIFIDWFGVHHLYAREP